MKQRVPFAASMFALALCAFMLSCSGGNPTPSTTVNALTPMGAPPNTAPSNPSVMVTISPSMGFNLSASQTQQFTAVASGSNPAVTWSLGTATYSPGWNLTDCATLDCGTVSATGLYTAPYFIPAAKTVWVKATAQADPKVFNSTPVTLVPISVYVNPNSPRNVLPGGSQEFAALVQYDAQNAGVTWTLSGAGCSGDSCGTLANVTAKSVMYQAPATAPSPPAVTLTATSLTDVQKSMSVMFTVSATPAQLLGRYAFLINGWRREGDVDTIEAVAGQFEADGTGNINGGWDANRGASVAPAQAFTGSYSIQPDGRGTLEFRAGISTWTYVIALDASGETARLAESTVASGQSNRRGSSGFLAKQDTSSFALSSTQGDRVIALYGEADCCHLAALGRFTGNPDGTMGNTGMDLSWKLHDSDQSFPNPVALSGSFGAPDAGSGRGVASLTLAATSGTPATYAFAYYVVSADTMLLVQTDTQGSASGTLIPVLSGEVRKQNGAGMFTNASLSLPLVFDLNNSSPFMWCGIFPAAIVGQVVPNGAGALATTFDENEAGETVVNTAAAGSYLVAANGRIALSLGIYSTYVSGKTAIHPALAYLVDENKGYLMQAGVRGSAFGWFEPQAGVPFSPASLAGTYVFSTGPATAALAQSDVGWLTLAEDGTVTGTVYFNTGSGTSPYVVRGSFTVAENGRGTLLLESPPPQIIPGGSYAFWMSSPTRGVALSWSDMSDLFYLERIGN